MAMTEDEFTQGSIDLLSRYGLNVARVATENGRRTPDLRGAGGPDLYAIELKQRDSDRALNALPIAGPPEPQQLEPRGLTRESAVQSLIREGVHQLRNEADTTFRLIWVHCEGFDSDTDQAQIQNAFLGTEYLLDRGLGGSAYMCHFFGESDFWRYRADLDGAIVSRQMDHDSVNLSLLLNPHSPRVGRFRDSTLVTTLGVAAVVDVIEEEAERECLIADCDIDRTEADNVLGYVSNKYGLDLIRLPVRRYGGVVRW